MSLILNWGSGEALPLPDGDPGSISVDEMPIGRAVRMRDGGLRVHRTAWKHRITIRWSGLTAAEWTLLHGRILSLRDSGGLLTLPTGETYSVMLAADPVKETLWFDWANTPIRDSVTVVFEEV